jgi:hypothetical protein
MSYNKPYATNLVPTNVTVADNAVVDNSGNTNGLKQVILSINFRPRANNVLPLK